jgi:hypothetical protein
MTPAYPRKVRVSFRRYTNMPTPAGKIIIVAFGAPFVLAGVILRVWLLWEWLHMTEEERNAPGSARSEYEPLDEGGMF